MNLKNSLFKIICQKNLISKNVRATIHLPKVMIEVSNGHLDA